MSAKQILINAKAMLPQRHNWLQGRARGVHWAPDGKKEQCLCPSEALLTATNTTHGRTGFDEVSGLFREAAGIGPNETIASWNDAKWRTYDEVMAGFDKAIEAAP